MQRVPETRSVNAPPLLFKGSRVWFSKENERRVFFALTLIMLVAGILIKVGII